MNALSTESSARGESSTRNRFAPVAIVAYRRPRHLRQCLEALARNPEIGTTNVTVFVDGPRSGSEADLVHHVVQIAQNFSGIEQLSVVVRQKNLGLSRSVIDAVNVSLEANESIIVLEDDLIVSPYFLRYMNDGINTYCDDSRVASIHGYVYPVQRRLPPTFFLRGADCLGWATWRSAWRLFNPSAAELLEQMSYMTEDERQDFDFNGTYPYLKMLRDVTLGQTDSWAIRWYASTFINNRMTLYPGTSLVFHAGSDGSGTNVGVTNALDVKLSRKGIVVGPLEPRDSAAGRRAFEEYFCRVRKKRMSVRRTCESAIRNWRNSWPLSR